MPFIGIQATHFPAASGKSVKCIAHDSNCIYALTPDGLQVINKSTSEVTVYDKESGHFGELGLNALALRPDTIWVGSNYGILTSITHGKAESSYHSFIPETGEEDACPIGINSIVFDSKGIMYIGGNNCISRIGSSLENMTQVFPSIYYGTEVWQMVVDNSDAVWISCTGAISGNSLMMYNADESLKVVGNSQLFSSSCVKGMTIDNDGNLWIGSYYVDANSEDGNENRARLLKYDGSGFSYFDVGGKYEAPISVKCDSQGRLWFLPTAPYSSVELQYKEYSKGPLCCLADGQLTKYDIDLQIGYCYCLDIDGDSIYIGTDNGVVVYSAGTFKWLINNQGANISNVTAQPSVSLLFDLQGRRLATEPKHGVYIRNGKKVVK